MCPQDGSPAHRAGSSSVNAAVGGSCGTCLSVDGTFPPEPRRLGLPVAALAGAPQARQTPHTTHDW